ncbi:ACT domain-containing protein, partial [Nocardiopsis tropica]|nr:ACT domain-containing protein [Nocardiopsis tropica]
GTLTGPRQIEKLVEINNYTMEIGLAEHMVFLAYEDRPGVVGKVGALLGDADVNIAGMQVIRDQEGGKALIALTVDSAVPEEILSSISGEIDADISRQIDLED